MNLPMSSIRTFTFSGNDCVKMMETDEDEILRSLVAGGSMKDYSAWPALLTRIIARIEMNAREEFPIPNLPPPPPPPGLLPVTTTVPSSIPQPAASGLQEGFLPPLPSSPTDPHTTSSSPDTNKENNPIVPESTPVAPRPSLVPPSSSPLPPGVLPPQIERMLTDITSYLKTTFPTYPPHTIQRIAELAVNPKQHYKTLTSYLHALDRVVHVTSGINIYPLPLAYTEVPGSLENTGLDITARSSSWAAPGSDEALGGALLTPIPWIQHHRRSSADSPTPATQAATFTEDAPAELEGEARTESTEAVERQDGLDSTEPVSASVEGIPAMGTQGAGVTQGELLRQEQRAGVVPVIQLSPKHVQTGPVNAMEASFQEKRLSQFPKDARRPRTQPRNRAASTSSEESGSSAGSAANAASPTLPATPEGTDAVAHGLDMPSTGHTVENDLGSRARGPGQIGVDDVGPQSGVLSRLSEPPATGGSIQGTDLPAAVGSKPSDVSSPKDQELSKDDTESDKMDIEEQGRPARLSTPKHDAGEHSDEPASKKRKEDVESRSPVEQTADTPAGSGVADVDQKPAATETEAKSKGDNNQGDAMDTD
ncbi:hypothetical protein F5Y17DRAFT_415627 [Xylariaceae sp. FL0594]|nr:hypothetical protein F5Y17DRAFT_415627 [Xylariaceae sp. FL0594]